MGNQTSTRKSSTSQNFKNDLDGDLLSVSPRLLTGVSENNLQKRKDESSEEKMIRDLRQMNLITELKKNKDMKSVSSDVVLIPTVFRWRGKGNKIYISGSFNDWKEKILLQKSDDLYYTIIHCTTGRHSFKFFINGEWVHDKLQPVEYNDFGTLNNYINVTKEDYDVDYALKYDEEHSKKSPTTDSEVPLDYGQEMPKRPNPFSETNLRNIVPAILPPYLNETVLNTIIQPHNDPSLLRSPYHVQLNHMYASSITSGVAALSVTIRYRSKYITTLFYKTIS